MRWRRVLLDKEKWHSWFAWYPVSINDMEMCWLETIQRRLIIGQWDWWYEYKPLKEMAPNTPDV